MRDLELTVGRESPKTLANSEIPTRRYGTGSMGWVRSRFLGVTDVTIFEMSVSLRGSTLIIERHEICCLENKAVRTDLAAFKSAEDAVTLQGY